MPTFPSHVKMTFCAVLRLRVSSNTPFSMLFHSMLNSWEEQDLFVAIMTTMLFSQI